MSIPFARPTPMAATFANGEAIPRAQGQVITRTVTARSRATSKDSPVQ